MENFILGADLVSKHFREQGENSTSDRQWRNYNFTLSKSVDSQVVQCTMSMLLYSIRSDNQSLTKCSSHRRRCWSKWLPTLLQFSISTTSCRITEVDHLKLAGRPIYGHVSVTGKFEYGSTNDLSTNQLSLDFCFFTDVIRGTYRLDPGF